MTRGVVIALGVAAAVLAVIVFKMIGGQQTGLRGGVPYYTPGAPNKIGGPPLPASNKLSTFLQGVTATADSAVGAVDSLTTLWEKTGKNWANSESEETYSTEYVDSLQNVQS